MNRSYTSLEKSFIEALKNGNVATIKQYLEQGGNVNLPISAREEPIRYMGQPDRNLFNEMLAGYMYPIHLAAKNGNLEILELLLAYKADVNSRATDSMTPLILATYFNKGKAVELLLQRGANPDQALKDATVALHTAALLDHANIAEILIAHKATVNVTDDVHETPLVVAVDKAKAKVAILLIESGADVNKANANGASPLFFAAQNGLEAVANKLLEKKANPNAIRRSDNTSPLQMAALKGHSNIVKSLVEAGAHITHVDAEGLTAAQWARISDYPQIGKYLEQCATKTPSSNPSSLFKQIGDEEIAKRFYQQGDYLKALEFYECALKSSKEAKNQAVLHCNMGHCAYALKDYEMAIAYYSNAIALKEDYTAAYEWRAKSQRKLAETGLVKASVSTYLESAARDEIMVKQLKGQVGKKLGM